MQNRRRVQISVPLNRELREFVERTAAREDRTLSSTPLDASALSHLRPRRAYDGNCSNHHQPEWKYLDARYRLKDQPRQKQPLPAQHDEQQRDSHNIDRPYDRRRQARQSTNDIGYTRDNEGECKLRC